MGNYKKKKSKQDSDEMASKGIGPDMKADFMRALDDAAKRADTKSIYEFSRGKSDHSLWKPGTILNFKDFCESADHMNFPPLSERQKMVAEYMFGDDPRQVFENNRNTAVLVWGKGGGKDTISELLNLYVIYLLLNLSNPQRFLGLPDNASIDLINIAASKEQATTVYFQGFKSFVLNWRWLRSQWDLSINGRFFSSGKQDEVDYMNKVTVTNDAVIFPGNIRAFSGSCEAETLEGKNVLMFVLDEADAFKTSSIYRSAAKIYRTMRTSAVSRFGKRYKGFVISYPRSQGGFIMDMYEKTKKLLNVYGDVAKTWEVKPRELFSPETFEFEGDKIPMDFYEDFRLDPLGSKSSYLCRPPEAESVYFDDYDKIELAAAGFSRPLFEFSEMVKEKKVVKRITKSPMLYDRSIVHVMALDLSETNDPTALTLMHREGDKVITDFITTWNPDPKKGVKVDLANVEEIIKAVRDSVSVKWFVADRWNSALFIQKLKSSGVNADASKLEFEDFELFKRLLYAGNIVIPRNEQLFKELKNLQLVSKERVDHPDGGHNDMTVTLVMAMKVLVKEKGNPGGVNLAAEGEYIGENLYEAVDSFADFVPIQPDGGLQIDGIPL